MRTYEHTQLGFPMIVISMVAGAAVELLLTSGKRLLIGTDEPQDLLRAIARRRPEVI